MGGLAVGERERRHRVVNSALGFVAEDKPKAPMWLHLARIRYLRMEGEMAWVTIAGPP